MSDTREHAHQLIDRMPEAQLSGLVQFLETIVDPVSAALRNAPLDEKPPSPRPRLGSRRTAARVFLTRKRCVGWAWSSGDRMD